eukprot:TRINITY_DN3109_c0_g1_i2.p1 TRINITY_DN3109_c0_g1~~TRINITY_DN3109_c0_g1_i2.p1  ORF type:complete len:167 (+),score=33.94 TRINITY_DN3109_c0_g1_i2:162-662(+)
MCIRDRYQRRVHGRVHGMVKDIIVAISPSVELNMIGQTAMHYIAINNRLDFLKAYFSRYGEAEIRKALQVPDSYGRYPIHYAAANGDVNMIAAFSHLGSPTLDSMTIGGETPLMKAAYFCNMTGYATLVAYGATTEAKNAVFKKQLFLAGIHDRRDPQNDGTKAFQ